MSSQQQKDEEVNSDSVTIQVHRCHNLFDSEAMSYFQGVSDPFVVLESPADGSELHRTEAIEDELNPVWQESRVTVSHGAVSCGVVIKVFNRNATVDDLIGCATISREDLFGSSSSEEKKEEGGNEEVTQRTILLFREDESQEGKQLAAGTIEVSWKVKRAPKKPKEAQKEEEEEQVAASDKKDDQQDKRQSGNGIQISCDGTSTITIRDHISQLQEPENEEGSVLHTFPLIPPTTENDDQVKDERHKAIVAFVRSLYDVKEEEEKEADADNTQLQTHEQQEQQEATAVQDGNESVVHKAQLFTCNTLLNDLIERIEALSRDRYAAARDKLLQIEAGLDNLLHDVAITSRPTLLQVVTHTDAPQLDIVRQAQDVSGTIYLERLPLTVQYASEVTKRHNEELKLARADYDDASAEMEDLVARQRREEEQKQQEEEGANPDEDSEHAWRKQQEDELLEMRRRLCGAFSAKQRAQHDVASWMENKALLQFAIEVLHASESEQLPIAHDDTRPQPMELLRTVRKNLGHLEQSLRINKSQSNSHDNSVAHSREIGAERVAIYREVDILRKNEKVLEACVAEKKQLLQLLHQDRMQFAKNLQDSRDALLDRDREVREAVSAATQLRRELAASSKEKEQLNTTVRHQREQIAKLKDYLDVVKMRRRTGVAGAVEGQSPYKIQSDAESRPITSHQHSALVDRLYTRELNKILHPVDKTKSLQHTAEPIDLGTFNDRMYYHRKDLQEQYREKARKKLQAEFEATSPQRQRGDGSSGGDGSGGGGDGSGGHSPQRTKEEIAQNVERMYARMQEREQKKAKLFQELVVGKEKHGPRMDDAERQAIAEKLYNRSKE